MRIALDAMGGDFAPEATVAGALLARRELGIEIALVGPTELIESEFKRHGALPTGVQIVHAAQAIRMDEAPAQAVRQKREASINVAMELVRQGVADAVVSAGNTGAVMASALMKLGRIHGIERPAIGALIPYRSKVLVLDVGANADCKPSWLVQFAQMGSVFMEKVYGVREPRVGLLNIGEEAGKGNELASEAYERLKALPGINFVGNIEGRDVHRGGVDVLVTDGFTGNVAVKVGEGVLEYAFGELRRVMTSTLRHKAAALVLRNALLQLRKEFDPNEYGGAPLLGVNGIVIIAHGRSDGPAIKNAIRQARDAAASGMLDALRSSLGSHRRFSIAAEL